MSGDDREYRRSSYRFMGARPSYTALRYTIEWRVKMSQAEFWRAYGISKRALQEWEGGRQPDSAARAYLTGIAKKPAVVRRALAIE